jgi:hypothetical protein
MAMAFSDSSFKRPKKSKRFKNSGEIIEGLQSANRLIINNGEA